MDIKAKIRVMELAQPQVYGIPSGLSKAVLNLEQAHCKIGMIGAYNVISLFRCLPRITPLTVGKIAMPKKGQYVLLWQSLDNYLAGLIWPALIIIVGQYMVIFSGGLTNRRKGNCKVYFVYIVSARNDTLNNDL